MNNILNLVIPTTQNRPKFFAAIDDSSECEKKNSLGNKFTSSGRAPLLLHSKT